jgi:hypothetical protein
MVATEDVPHMLAYLHNITKHGGRDATLAYGLSREKVFWQGM